MTYARVSNLAIAAAACMLFSSCEIGTGLGHGNLVGLDPVEEFTEADRPGTVAVSLGGLSFNLDLPWGYARSANASRKYPIVVNGCWGEGKLFTEAARKRYPAFFLDFNNYYTDEHGALLSGLLDSVETGYRIDMGRVYLTGFSQGGSGSFKLVRGMLSKGKLFAAIIRVAGQSESVLADEAAAKTSLWYHIGLDDDAARVQVARDTYADLKGRAIDAGAIETTRADSMTGFERITKTLKRDGIEMFKYSEYTGMGHDPGPCYRDPALLDWLFAQSLALRK
jgi:predicted peptidase